jgi:DNA-binding transcriptional ArsR family regulator
MPPADQFFALADATRCRVVEMLSAKPMPVHELTAAFSISRPAISRHLRVLKQAQLVTEIKRGRENVYSLERDNLAPLLAWLGRQGVGKPRAPRAAAVKVLPAAPEVVPAAPEPLAIAVPVVVPVAPARPVRKRAAPALAEAQLDLF